MAHKRPATIAEYIDDAPATAQPHLREVCAILEAAAPQAQAVIKWHTPFFVEPRFLFAFSAHKAHLSLAPAATALEAFAAELSAYKTTKNTLQLPYKQPVPADLVRRIAEYCVRTVNEREDEAFW
jgi:uncharacterized protein YdhG (YjbR/CyaY superfamily)